MFGYRAEEVLGKPLQMLLPERYRKAHLGEVSAFGRSRDASRWMSDRGPVTGLRSVSYSPLRAHVTVLSLVCCLQLDFSNTTFLL